MGSVPRSKRELVHHRCYISRQEAIQDITEYIEIFYSRQRKQKRPGYLSPVAYEKNSVKEGLQHEPFGIHY